MILKALQLVRNVETVNGEIKKQNSNSFSCNNTHNKNMNSNFIKFTKIRRYILTTALGAKSITTAASKAILFHPSRSRDSPRAAGAALFG